MHVERKMRWMKKGSFSMLSRMNGMEFVSYQTDKIIKLCYHTHNK